MDNWTIDLIFFLFVLFSFSSLFCCSPFLFVYTLVSLSLILFRLFDTKIMHIFAISLSINHFVR